MGRCTFFTETLTDLEVATATADDPAEAIFLIWKPKT
jgi:hypothetical protein